MQGRRFKSSLAHQIMKEIPLILLGGGFSSIEIIDLIEDINKFDKEKFIKIIGILDDKKKINSKINGVKIIGKLSDAKKFKKENFFVNIFDRNNRFLRPNIIEKLNIKLERYFSIIHPHNLIGKNAKIGKGVSIYPGSTIFSNSKIGNFCNIMPNVSLASNSIIQDNCFIGKDVFIGSGSVVKKNVYISNSTTVLENVQINEGSRIIPHSMVNRNITKKNTVSGGVPSRTLFNEKIVKNDYKLSKFKTYLAKKSDLKFLFKLYNKNVLEKKFFSLKQVSFEEHKVWFTKKIREKMFFVSTDGHEKIGYVRFDKINKQNLSVSIAIQKKFQRKGYGKKMLNNVLRKKIIKRYNVWAYIVKNNTISKNFFKNLGFKFFKNNKFFKSKD